MKTPMNRVAPLLCFLVALPMIASCSPTLKGEAIDGVVIDLANNKPVPNAVVSASWYGSRGWGGSTVCYHLEAAVTGGNGHFHFPAWHEPDDGSMGAIWPTDPDNMGLRRGATAIGYKLSSISSKMSQKKWVFNIEPLTRTREQQFKDLLEIADWRASNECPTDQSAHELALYVQVAYKQARANAVTPEELAVVDKLAKRLEQLKDDLPRPEGPGKPKDRNRRLSNEDLQRELDRLPTRPKTSVDSVR